MSYYLYHYRFIFQFIYFNYLISVAYPEGFQHQYPGLGAQIKEKILLIQIIEDKISIAIVSKHCKKFNFTISLFFVFFKKKSNQNWTAFICFNQFLLPILNWAFCIHFEHRYWFWSSLIIFRPEAINPRNIRGYLKESLK